MGLDTCILRFCILLTIIEKKNNYIKKIILKIVSIAQYYIKIQNEIETNQYYYSKHPCIIVVYL